MIDWIRKLLGLKGNPTGLYYVYELKDPRFNPHKVFYVGKGTEDRMYEHEKELRRLLKRGRSGAMRLSCKHKRILEILDAGESVRYSIIFRTDNEAEAYRVESAYIDRIGLERLTNETYGYRPRRVAA